MLNRLVLMALGAGALLAACSDEGTRTPDEPTGQSLIGELRIVSALSNPTGAVTDSNEIEADGLMVRLYAIGGRSEVEIVDSTRAVGGRYAFTGVSSGMYEVRTWVDSDFPVASSLIVVGEEDVQVADTLRLVPEGELRTYPNPFPRPNGLSIEFTTVSTQDVVAVVLNEAGEEVWRYGFTGPPNYYHVHWSGIDSRFEPVPAGEYWVRVQADGEPRYNLVFLEEAGRAFSATGVARAFTDR